MIETLGRREIRVNLTECHRRAMCSRLSVLTTLSISRRMAEGAELIRKVTRAMGKRWVAICLALIALPLGLTVPAMSQEVVPTPGPSTTFTALVVDIDSDSLPITVTRIVLDEGGVLPFGDHHGPAVVLVSEGELTFNSPDVHLLVSEITDASGTASPPAANPGSAGTGDLLFVPAEADVTLVAGSENPAALVVLELGETIDPDMLPEGSRVTPLVSNAFQLDITRIRLDIRRLTLAQWATTDEWPTDQARVVIIENGALALELEGGMAQIGRGYGGQETLIAVAGEDSAEPQADPEADPEASSEMSEGTTPYPTPPVPPLSGTVAGLATGDVAIVSGAGGIEIQGVSEEPATVLSISLTSVDND
jgi:hypothetical protein